MEYSLLYTRGPDAIHHFGRSGHYEPDRDLDAKLPFLAEVAKGGVALRE